MTRTFSFLEREEGIPYSGVFGCLRLHGITGSKFLSIVSQVFADASHVFVRSDFCLLTYTLL